MLEFKLVTRVYPRKIVLRVLHHQCTAVVLAHNYPSESMQPSRADETLTQTLKSALAIVDVRVLVHVMFQHSAIQQHCAEALG